jgi:sodium/proline symporter
MNSLPATSDITVNWNILGGLILYLVAVLVVGFWTYRYMRTLDDFVLGGRRLGPWVAAISERASGESAWFLLGLPGAAYALGFTEFWSVIGIAFGIFASWTLLAGPLRRATGKTGALTIPDYFETRYSDSSHSLRIVSMVIILFFYTFYVSAQFVGAGKILNATFNLDTEPGIIIGATIVVFYTLMGGFLAVAWTDLVQGLLMVTVAIVLPILGFVKLHHAGGFLQAVSVRGDAFLTLRAMMIEGDLSTITGAAAFGLIIGSLSWGFGYLGQPHLLTRYMAIRKERDLRKGTLIAMVWVLLAYWGAVLIGVTGVGILGPDIADQEHVMPLLAKALVPSWIAGLMIAGGIAAMMSTADSQLIVATSALIEDIYARLIHPSVTPGRMVLLSRIATVIIAGIALLLAFANEDLIFDLVAYAWAGIGSSIGPPLLLSLRWRRTTRWGVFSGMLGGMTATILWKNLAALNSALDLKLASFLISLFLTFAVSLLTKPPSESTSYISNQ